MNVGFRLGAAVQLTTDLCNRRAETGRVEMWRGGFRFGLSVAAPFVWRYPSNLTVTPFPHPAHRTGHADFPHPALGQDTYFRTRKVVRMSPTHRTVLCDTCVNPASVMLTTANATAWVVIRFPDRSPVLSSLQHVAPSAAPAH